MAETKIEWADYTHNPWIGCTKVSPGCDNCYAEAMMDHRYGKVQWGPHGERKRTSAANRELPLRWAKQAHQRFLAGDLRRPRVFCASLADVFDNQVPLAWRSELFHIISITPELDWLLLTKRPENIMRMLPALWGNGWYHVWLGVSAEDVEHFQRRWDIMRKIPAAVRFVSYEPALGPLIISQMSEPQPDWIICGGESGPKARPMDPAWARFLRDQCQDWGVAFFMKQMSRKAAIPDDLMVRQFPR